MKNPGYRTTVNFHRSAPIVVVREYQKASLVTGRLAKIYHTKNTSFSIYQTSTGVLIEISYGTKDFDDEAIRIIRRRAREFCKELAPYFS